VTGVQTCALPICHLHVVPRWNMRGDTPPLRLYVFMAWTGAKLTFCLYLAPSHAGQFMMTFAELTTACVTIIYHYLLCFSASVRVRLRDCILRQTEVTQTRFSTILCAIGSSLQRRPFISVPFYKSPPPSSDCVVPNLSRLSRCCL
jgi:hypothetical protein